MILAMTLVILSGNIYAAQPDREIVVAVSLPDRAALDVLVSEGFVIDAVDDTTATVYATPEDLARLTALGYTWRPVDRATGLPDAKTLEGYHDYSQVTALLQDYAAAYPDILQLMSLGRSVQGRELWVVLITDCPVEEEDEPEFKYIGAVHGDEPLGTELCLRFIDRLLTAYGSDPYITGLVNTTAIWILPLMNPDGREGGRRGNANGADLNRWFPIYPDDYTVTLWDGEELDLEGRPPEVQHVMAWTAARSFVLSASFHAGSLVVNYPYDDDGRGSIDSPTPDDLLFENLARRYSYNNTPMYENPQFDDGITNGAAWYAITGGMQDWNYRYAGCMEVTIELSNTKWPAGSSLPAYWADNEAAMFAYLEAVHLGVRGLVTDRPSGAPLWAKVSLAGNTHPVFTDPEAGDYHRLLLPGLYSLSFTAPGYIPYRTNAFVVGAGEASRIDVTLSDGDVDWDGWIGAADVQTVVNAALKLPVDVDADVDGRGVSESDLEHVVNRALGR